MRTILKSSLAALLLAAPWALYADDWPQWRGPLRTDISQEKGLLKKWPKEGPKLLWSYKEAGSGYTAPAVVGDVVYTMGARKGDDYLIALNVKDGKELWSKKIGPSYPKTQWSDGPNATPTVDKELIFALSSNGELACFDLKGEKQVWSLDLQKTMKAKVNPIFAAPNSQGWGFAWSPLVDSDQLIITPGGPDGLVVALDKKKGTVHWKSDKIKDECTYASPIVAEIDGVRQYIVMVQTGAVGVSAKDGSELWRYKRKRQWDDVVCTTPIYKDNHIFVTATNSGYALVEVKKMGEGFTAKQLVADKDFANSHGGVVLVDKHLYGANKDRDWQCLDFSDPKNVAWTTSDLDSGSLTVADGMVFAVTAKTGDVVLFEATPKEYKELARFPLPQASKSRPPSGQIWSHPVIANGRLYLRDQELIFCYEVK